MDNQDRYPDFRRDDDARGGKEPATRPKQQEHSSTLPLMLHFSWRPEYNDFPVALVQPSSTVRPAREYPPSDTSWIPRVEVLSAPRPLIRYAPHVAAVGIVALVVAGGWWWRSDGDSPPPAATATISASGAQGADPTATGDTRWPTPGLGGGLSPDTNDEPSATATESAELDASATAESEDATASATASLLETAITTVTVQAGETLVELAEQFGVDVRTLLWANEIADPNVFLAKDTEVIVPKENGVVHTVATGDTLEAIAAVYEVDPTVIVDQAGNALTTDADLEVGALVLVPGGVLLDRGRIDTYVVRDGDTLWQIADYYGLDPATLLWANELPRAELIYTDQELIIPPGNGALVTVQAGETVDSLAARFEANPAAIRAYGFNGLGPNGEPAEEQQLLVPGPVLPPAAEGPSELTAETVAGEGVVGPATGSFLWPTEGWVTQQFHAEHSGVDIANEEWTPVNATDGGIVIFAGWNDYGLGYAVGIDHGNGYQTWYGHLANEPYVEVGQVIWQGGYLGPMGTTGKSTGPHLHFVVIQDGVYQNPLDYLE